MPLIGISQNINSDFAIKNTRTQLDSFFIENKNSSIEEISYFLQSERYDFLWPEIPPELVAGATVASAIFGGISAINSFRQVSELKEINQKLDKIIALQYEILKAIKDLSIQFRIDLEKAFIKDIELELKAYQQSFVTLTDVMIQRGNRIIFPRNGPDYQARLEDLMWKVQDLSNKLKGYGPVTHYALFTSIGLLETMFKVANVDFKYRQSFLKQNLITVLEFETYFKNKSDELLNQSTEFYNKNKIDGIKSIVGGQFGLDYPFTEIKGNPKDGFHSRTWVREKQEKPEFRPVIKGPYYDIQVQYNEMVSRHIKFKDGVIPIFDIISKELNKLILLYNE